MVVPHLGASAPGGACVLQLHAEQCRNVLDDSVCSRIGHPVPLDVDESANLEVHLRGVQDGCGGEVVV